MSQRMNSRAFTLIEILISIALGMVILGTVYAGFRVSTQSMIACNRLSIENRLLTAGVLRAMDEVDFWQTMDRPDWRPLRREPPYVQMQGAWGGFSDDGSDAYKIPQPFTPFAKSWKVDYNQIMPASGTVNRYDHVWLPHDRKTWFRGDGFLYLTWDAFTDQSWWGDYGLFSGTEASVDHLGSSTEVGVPTAEPDRYTWYACQQKGLKAALGFYGWWDYLPANAVLTFYDHHPGNPRCVLYPETSLRVMPRGTTKDDKADSPPAPMTGHGRFTAWMGGPYASGNERPMTRSSFLWEHVMGICAPRPAIPNRLADGVNQALMINRWMGGSRWVGNDGWETQGAFNRLSQELTRPMPLVVRQPRHWPQVTLDVRRYRMFSRCVNECFVRVFDPLSAKMVELNFRTTGTTLRGARLQRDDPASTLDDDAP
jgi:hypothetical protein